VRNMVSDTGAQSIEVKEGSSDGLIYENRVDDSASTSPESSLVLIKGNGWLVKNNSGKGGRADGFDTNASVSGWGMRNVFVGNAATLNSAGYGIWIHQPAGRPPLGNIVACDNRAVGASGGITNVACQP
jgi:hypothetical protein